MSRKWMGKKVMAAILSATILTSVCPEPLLASAQTEASETEQGTNPTGEVMEVETSMEQSVLGSGICGENLTWELTSDGVLTISGTGDMYGFSEDESGIWKEYVSSIMSIVIEEGVTSIGQYAFAGCENLTSLTLPASVGVIGDFAFSGCSSLTLSIPADSSLTALWSGPATFVGVKEVVVAEGNQNFVSQDGVLFAHDSHPDILDLVKYPEGKVDTSYVIPEGVFTICGYGFYNAKNLIEIVIPDYLQSIGEYAFAGCSSLQTMNIPKSVCYIYPGAFSDCSGLKEVYFYGDAPEFYSDVFLNDTIIAYYPANNASWTEDVKQSYGGTVTWAEWTPGTDAGNDSGTGDGGTVAGDNSFDASFETALVFDYLNSISQYLIGLRVPATANEQLNELSAIFESGNLYSDMYTDVYGEYTTLSCWAWVADSENEVYQICEDSFTDLNSQNFILRSDWTKLKTLFDEYNEAKAAYDSDMAFTEAKRVLQEVVDVAVKLEDREAPYVLPNQVVTDETGTIETSAGKTVEVRLVFEELGKNSVNPSVVAELMANSGVSGYEVTNIRLFYLFRTDIGMSIPVNNGITILIEYPEGYGTENDYLIYHNIDNGWEAVTILEKTAKGLICQVSSPSYFIISVKTSDDTGTGNSSFSAYFGTSFDSDYLTSTARPVFNLQTSNATDEQLNELHEIFESGDMYCFNNAYADDGSLWCSIWVTDSEEEVYQYYADRFICLFDQLIMTRADWTRLKTLVNEYNEISATYDADTAFTETKRILQEIAAMPRMLEDREPPSVMPDQEVTNETGTIETSAGMTVGVTLVSDTVSEDAGYHSAVTEILENNAASYTLTDVRDVYLIRTDNGAYVPVKDAITILITYPEGYGSENDYLVYHNRTDGWEEVTIREKTAEGLICQASSLSPFAVAVKMPEGNEPLIVKGDINSDGIINVRDLMLCLYHVSGKTPLTGDEFTAADIDGNGSVVITDLMKLLYYVSGKNAEL